MQYKEWTYVDRSGWPEGPWDKEPDQAIWVDEKTGYYCSIIRNPLGALCGYVMVPKSHKMYLKHYDDVPYDCHGGLTFSEYSFAKVNHKKCVQYIPFNKEKDPKKMKIFGFDCAHLGDISPKMLDLFSSMHHLIGESESYKGWEYVRNEVETLALQFWADDESAKAFIKIRKEIGL